jgi:hypothetical protein
MKKSYSILYLVLFSSFLLLGCRSNVSEPNKVHREEFVKIGGEILESKHAKKVIDIIENADWIQKEVQMKGNPDYKIQYNSKTYDVWFQPKYKKAEIVIMGEDLFTELSSEESEKLYKIITSKK